MPSETMPPETAPPELTPLEYARHGSLKVRKAALMEAAAGEQLVQVRAVEVGKAACCFPLFFTRSPRSGHWILSAMTGLEAHGNLFVDKGQWQASFTPSAMQSFPLFLMRDEDAGDEERPRVAINEKSPAFSEQEGEALFDDGGEPSIYQRNLTRILEADIRNDYHTFQFTGLLEELGLLRPIDVVVQYPDGSAHTLTGLFCVNEERLRSLDDKDLLKLRESGFLLPAHAMLISLYQVNTLIRKQNLRRDLRPVKQVKLGLPKDHGAS